MRISKLLMNKAGEEQGGGTGGASLLTTPSGGGGTGTAAKGGDTKSGAGTGDSPAGTGSANSNSQGDQVPSWKSSLPKELQDDPALRAFNDVGALAKSYIHAQKLVGAEKIAIPSKHATEDDWQQVFKKLGLPDADKYEVKLEGEFLDKEFSKKFKEQAHAAGILPSQAQKLADWFAKTNSESTAQVEQMRIAKIKEDVGALQKEWGAAFEQNVGRAQLVLREFADADMVKYLEDTGLGNDVQLVKLLSKVGTLLNEDKLIHQNPGGSGKLSPADAQKEYNKILSTKDHPYWKKDHPNHANAMAEVQALFQQMYPSENNA